MINVTLSVDDHHLLEHTFKTTPDRRLCDRCQALLMAASKHHYLQEGFARHLRAMARAYPVATTPRGGD